MLFIGFIIGAVVGAVQAAAGAAVSTGLSAVGLGGRLAYGAYLNTVRAIVLVGRGAGAAGAPGAGLGGFGGGGFSGGGASGSWGDNTASNSQAPTQTPTNLAQTTDELPTSGASGTQITSGNDFMEGEYNPLEITYTKSGAANTPQLPSFLNTEPINNNVLKKERRNSAVLRSVPTERNILAKAMHGARNNFPTAPLYEWQNVNTEYWKLYNEQSNSDFYRVKNRNGTYTYVEKTPQEEFYYYDNHLRQWQPFVPDGYLTYKQRIQRLKNIAAATGVFGEKYEALLQTITYGLLYLASGGALARALFSVSYEVLTQFLTSYKKGETYTPDYFDLLIEAVPVSKIPGGDLAKDIVKDTFKILVKMNEEGKLELDTDGSKLKKNIVSSIVAIIIGKYRRKLFGSNLASTEKNLVEVVTKIITLISSVYIATIYDKNK